MTMYNGQSKWCYVFRPPEFPPTTHPRYSELWHFVVSNGDLKASYDAYHDACSDDTQPTTPYTLQADCLIRCFVSARDAVGGKTRSHEWLCRDVIMSFRQLPRELIQRAESDSACRNGTQPTAPPDTGSSSTKGSTASAGLIVGLVILFVFFIILVFAALWWWKKKRKGENQSSKALAMEEYETKNYLHNKAVKKESWSSSSVEEGSIEQQKNHVPIQESKNGDIPAVSNDRLRKLKQKDSAEKGTVNESFTTDETVKDDPESPGIKSVKSDTPLIADDVDGPILPGQTTALDTKNQTVLEGGDKRARYGSTNASVVPNGNKLPPVETRVKVPTKKKRSSKDLRTSAPCQNTEGLAEDLGENRKSV